MCRSGPWCQMRARTSLSDAFADESEVLKKGELPVNRGWCRVEGGAKVVEGDLLVDRVEGRGREEKATTRDVEAPEEGGEAISVRPLRISTKESGRQRARCCQIPSTASNSVHHINERDTYHSKIAVAVSRGHLKESKRDGFAPIAPLAPTDPTRDRSSTWEHPWRRHAHLLPAK